MARRAAQARSFQTGNPPPRPPPPLATPPPAPRPRGIPPDPQREEQPPDEDRVDRMQADARRMEDERTGAGQGVVEREARHRQRMVIPDDDERRHANERRGRLRVEDLIILDVVEVVPDEPTVERGIEGEQGGGRDEDRTEIDRGARRAGARGPFRHEAGDFTLPAWRRQWQIGAVPAQPQTAAITARSLPSRQPSFVYSTGAQGSDGTDAEHWPKNRPRSARSNPLTTPSAPPK